MMSIKIGCLTHLKKNDSFTLSKITNLRFEVIMWTLFKKLQYSESNNVTTTDRGKRNIKFLQVCILDLWEVFLLFMEFLLRFNFLLFFNTVNKIIQHVGIYVWIDLYLYCL